MGLEDLLGGEFERAYLVAQCRQRVEPMHHGGDAREQARATGQQPRFGVEPVKTGTHLGLDRIAVGDAAVELVDEARATRSGIDVGYAAFALQRVDELPDAADQFAGQRELFQAVNLAASGCDEELECRGHDASLPAMRSPPERTRGSCRWECRQSSKEDRKSTRLNSSHVRISY